MGDKTGFPRDSHNYNKKLFIATMPNPMIGSYEQLNFYFAMVLSINPLLYSIQKLQLHICSHIRHKTKTLT